MWYVYILKCADETLYTGISCDLKRRLEEHNRSEKGAKYTRSRRPVALAYSKRFRTRAAAQRREAKLKKLTRAAKLALIEQTK